MTIRILTGDCRAMLKTLPDASVDSIVTDPPYELGFMGKKWDNTGIAFSPIVWGECMRVLKPGGHLLAFSGTRTQHRMVCAIEDAGFEIRDCIRSLNGDEHYPAWAFGTGFPKNLDVSKAIDKAAGAARHCTREGAVQRDGYGGDWDTGDSSTRPRFDNPASAAAAAWQGWGTALKPAWEPICVARKPLIGTVAANVLAHGTGAINIGACRVDTTEDLNGGGYSPVNGARHDGTESWGMRNGGAGEYSQPLGRWPANLLHDGSPEVVALFPESASIGHHPAARGAGGVSTIGHAGQTDLAERHGDTGSAARFFWCPKTNATDRHDGLGQVGHQFKAGSTLRDGENVGKGRVGNHHPTVKPTELMRYLVRLVTPPLGTVLDPFMGSGSTLKAAELEGFSAIGIEIDPAYVEIAQRRIGSDCPLFAEVAA